MHKVAIVNFPPMDERSLALTTAIELDAKAMRTHIIEGRRAPTASVTINCVLRSSSLMDCCHIGRAGMRASIMATIAR